MKKDSNLIETILTWDGIVVVDFFSCSPWIWPSLSESIPSNVNICSFSWDEEVWSVVFDTTSWTASLTDVDGCVIVSSIVSVAVVTSSSLFWSILVVGI